MEHQIANDDELASIFEMRERTAGSGIASVSSILKA